MLFFIPFEKDSGDPHSHTQSAHSEHQADNARGRLDEGNGIGVMVGRKGGGGVVS